MKSLFQRLIAISAAFCLVVTMSGCKTTSTKTKQTLGEASHLNITLARPTAPESLAATAADGSVALTWTLDQEAKTLPLTLYRWQAGGVPAVLKTLPAGQTAFTDTGLANGTKYFYLLITVDKIQLASSCRAMTAVIPVAPPPPKAVEQPDSTNLEGGSGSNNSETFPYREVVEIVTCPFCGGSGTTPGAPGPFGEPGPPETCWCNGKGVLRRITFYENNFGPCVRYESI